MFSVSSSFNHQCSPCFTASSFKYIFDVFKVCIKLLIDSWFQFLSLYLNLLTREEDEANRVESDIAEQFLERSSPPLSLFLMIDWLRFLVTLYNTTPGFWMVEGPKTPLSCRTGSLIRWDPVKSPSIRKSLNDIPLCCRFGGRPISRQLHCWQKVTSSHCVVIHHHFRITL